MHSKYNSNTRKLNRIYVPRKIENTDITGSLDAISIPSSNLYRSTTRKELNVSKIINPNSLQNLDITGSLQNIEAPSNKTYNPYSKSNSTLPKVINNDNKINDFHAEIFEFSARYIKKEISSYDAEASTFILNNTLLDYGTEGTTSENFEVIVSGLQLPSSTYKVEQVGNDVFIIFNEILFSYDGLQTENVIVIGKFLDIGMETENEIGLTTEDNEPLIL